MEGRVQDHLQRRKVCTHCAWQLIRVIGQIFDQSSINSASVDRERFSTSKNLNINRKEKLLVLLCTAVIHPKKTLKPGYFRIGITRDRLTDTFSQAFIAINSKDRAYKKTSEIQFCISSPMAKKD